MEKHPQEPVAPTPKEIRDPDFNPLKNITSRKLDKLAPDLVNFQRKVKSPDRNKHGKVYKNGEFKYSWRYASLDRLFEATQELLADCNMAVTQIPREKDVGAYELVTLLLHTTGQWIMGVTPILSDGRSNQEFGSALTYAKRYAYGSILRVAGEEDDDANAADGNTQVPTDEKPPRRKPGRPRKDQNTAPQPTATPKTAQKKAPKPKAKTQKTETSAKILIPSKHRKSGKHNWRQWARDMCQLAVKLKHPDKVFQLAELNTNHLVKCHEAAPKIHDDLLAYLNRFQTATPEPGENTDAIPTQEETKKTKGPNGSEGTGQDNAPPKDRKS